MGAVNGTGESLTPPRYIKKARYWDKVAEIKQHLLISWNEDRFVCACDIAIDYDDKDQWAQHVADVLFPHEGLHDAQ